MELTESQPKKQSTRERQGPQSNRNQVFPTLRELFQADKFECQPKNCPPSRCRANDRGGFTTALNRLNHSEMTEQTA